MKSPFLEKDYESIRQKAYADIIWKNRREEDGSSSGPGAAALPLDETHMENFRFYMPTEVPRRGLRSFI